MSGGPLFTTRGAETSVTVYRRELHPTHHTTARQKVSAILRSRSDPCNRHQVTGSTSPPAARI
ncbi:MAG: hypothetical protein L0L18_00990 [Acidipropionibacterium jensenii]|nr:hypothetical protein [Acidipropionibacterium jensenii]